MFNLDLDKLPDANRAIEESKKYREAIIEDQYTRIYQKVNDTIKRGLSYFEINEVLMPEIKRILLDKHYTICNAGTEQEPTIFIYFKDPKIKK